MTNADGYVFQYCPQHPRAKNGFVPLHQLVVEEMIGRYLDTRREHIHHIDGNPGNNDPANLQIVDPGIHHRFHHGWKLIGTEWHKPCGPCGQFLKVEGNFYKRRTGKGHQGDCIKCNLRSRKARKSDIRNHRVAPGPQTPRVIAIAELWRRGLSIRQMAELAGVKFSSLAADIHGNLRPRWPHLFPYRDKARRKAQLKEAA